MLGSIGGMFVAWMIWYRKVARISVSNHRYDKEKWCKWTKNWES